jgi:hypothetical protein
MDPILISKPAQRKPVRRVRFHTHHEERHFSADPRQSEDTTTTETSEPTKVAPEYVRPTQLQLSLQQHQFDNSLAQKRFTKPTSYSEILRRRAEFERMNPPQHRTSALPPPMPNTQHIQPNPFFQAFSDSLTPDSAPWGMEGQDNRPYVSGCESNQFLVLAFS